MPDDPGPHPADGHAVVLAGDSSYARPLLVAVSSLARHTPPVALLVLIDLGLTPDDRQQLSQAARPWSVQFVEVPPGRLDGLPRNRLPLGTYARLFVTQLVGEGCRRILYLDGDVLVRASVLPLLQVDLAGHTVGAVGDRRATHFAHPAASPYLPGWQEAGIPPSCMVFNSGVMVIDRAAWDERAVTARVLAVARGGQATAAWADQAFLNLVLWDDWWPLDSGWNDRADDALVAHFAGPYKPWAPPTMPTRLYADYVAAASALGWRLPGRHTLGAGAAAHRVGRALWPDHRSGSAQA